MQLVKLPCNILTTIEQINRQTTVRVHSTKFEHLTACYWKEITRITVVDIFNKTSTKT